ncbi:hypothetical protein [Hymenobacter guriensis]|uniref:Uncharacterized protein n=1 Tax=Hymenobacter guriensis TaxID=2793065 RepID=A0ABS0L839_9BACT|nr:hypothetical protein [Hymenobacter guriensis]MBG8556301.1 hypothetical protein [Hymenobacter guriensis]
MNFYRSPDSDASDGAPSYARLAARLRLLPSYAHPNSQALLDKLEQGEIDSEECLHELTQDVIKRTEHAQEHARQLQLHDTEQQRQQQEQRMRVDEEIASNATTDEPTIVNADVDAEDSPTSADDAQASTAQAFSPTAPPASTGKGSSGGTNGIAQTPGNSAISELGWSSSNNEVDTAGVLDSGAFDAGTSGQHGSLDEDDERDERFED